MLFPTAKWFWYLDKDDKLAIDLGEELCFVTPFKSSKLRMDNRDGVAFDSTHMEVYMAIAGILEDAEQCLSAAYKTQICLNATAALCFHKPVSVKSWLYQGAGHQSHLSEFTTLKGLDCDTVALILEQRNSMVTCLQLAQSFTTLDGKQHQAFALHKVSCDRLFALQNEQPQLKTA